MLDILIKHSTVVDGTGQPAFRADVGVAGDRIVMMAEAIEHQAAREIDAQGLHLTPGFIDPHTHSDLPLLVDPPGQSKIRQGVTTEVVGNCGFSPAPVLGAATQVIAARAAEWCLDVTWQGMGGYLDRLRHSGTVLNVVPLVGHNTVRGAVLGYDDVQPTPQQQASMEGMVEQAMQEGARGLSSGLFYPPGYYARPEEVIGLAEVAARYDGVYATHVRSETDLLLPAIAEAVDVGEQAGIRVEIAHVKIEGYRNWPVIDELMAYLDDIQARGLQVGCDQYPYIACNTWLMAMMPYWAQAGGERAAAERVRDPQVRIALQRDLKQNPTEWENRSGVRDWADLIVSDCPNCEEFEGKDLAKVAEILGKDPLSAVFDLVVASEGAASAVCFTQLEKNIKALMKHPLVVVGSDGSSLKPEGLLGKRKVHPRSYGAFPRVLGRYVRQEGLLTLEEAVKKMTSMTAERFGLTDRGVVRQGAYADLVLFDPERVIDQATYSDPHQYPEGIPYVLVNGAVVIDAGQYSGALPGQVL